MITDSKIKMRLQFKQKIMIPLLVCAFLLTSVQAALAVTSPTPTAKPSLTGTVTPTNPSSPTPTEAVSDEIKEKVQERIDSIKETGKKKAFWGTLKNRSNSLLVIDAPTGEKRIKTDETTIFVGTGKKLIKIDDLEIGNFIIALGYWQENGTLTAKRVIALATPPKPAPKRDTVYGNISLVNKTKKSLEITPIGPESSSPKNILVSTSAIIVKNTNGKISKGVFDTITKGDLILSVCTPKEGDDTTCTGKIIYITPSDNSNLPTPTPIASKQPTPSSSTTE